MTPTSFGEAWNMNRVLRRLPRSKSVAERPANVLQHPERTTMRCTTKKKEGMITSRPPGNPAMEITSELLVRMSCTIVMQPTRGPDDTAYLQEHLSPKFCATLDARPMAFSAQQYIRNVQSFLVDNPTWRSDIIATAAMLTDEGRRATVWVTLIAEGIQAHESQSTSREAVNKLRWRRLNGMRWVCTSCHVVRGPGRTIF
jgi:hypothetical protein